MYKIVLGIDGMKCGMCEAHINDLIRKKIKVNKVSSNHKKGETTIICDTYLSQDLLDNVFEGSGYKIDSLKREEAKKTLFEYK